MKMNGKHVIVLLWISVFFVFFSINGWSAPQKDALTFNTYHSPKDVEGLLKDIAASHSGNAVLHKMASTPGGNDVIIMEIGTEIGKKEKKLPAIWVVANMEGTVPVSTEAALYLIRSLIDQPEQWKSKTWYILPIGNPDAAWHYFQKPLLMDARNKRPYNDDMDDQVDEDGVDDLDGNGIITMMRVKDPQGEWMAIPGNPLLMKRPDWSKGEKGEYKLYTEGLDNDNDGQYNEDGLGGVNTGINFPHLFKYHTVISGMWPGSEPETYSLFKFAHEHPEIAMTICFGKTNFCLTPPRGGRKEAVDMSKIKLPEWIGKIYGMDTTRTYTMEEIMDFAKTLAPAGFEISESMVAGMLGLGAAVNPQPEDLKFFNAISEEYKEFLKKNKMDAKRLDSEQDEDGSFELWSYYQLGLPSFTLDFWSLPQVEEEKKGDTLSPEKLETMTNDEFLALGEEKIDGFLKASGAPGNIKAKMLMDMIKNGMMTTKKMAEMMKQMPKPKSPEGVKQEDKALLAFNEKQLGGKGFIQWKSFNHPQLGEVEIGGEVPFVRNTPPVSMVEDLLKNQVPWVFELAKKIPSIRIEKAESTSLGSGIYKVKAWIENKGFLPYPTAMGKRDQQILPAIVTLEGKDLTFVEGKKRSMVSDFRGFSTRTVEWIVRTGQPGQLTVTVSTPNAGTDTRTVSQGKGGIK